jgi:hypothetical protein
VAELDGWSVRIVLGDTSDCLDQEIQSLEEPVIFWPDAHIQTDAEWSWRWPKEVSSYR